MYGIIFINPASRKVTLNKKSGQENPQSSEHSDKWTLRQMNPETTNKWILRKLNPETMEKWTLRQVNRRTRERIPTCRPISIFYLPFTLPNQQISILPVPRQVTFGNSSKLYISVSLNMIMTRWQYRIMGGPPNLRQFHFLQYR